jgi:hypothetical protein
MKKVLLIGAFFPEPNSTAAGTKMMQWLEFFNALGYQIEYASTSPKSEFSADISSFVSHTFVAKVNDSSFDNSIRECQPDIVLYDRFMIEEQFGWRIRELFPTCIHLLETQDLHFLREARTNNASIYNTTTKRELASILRCDLSFIISEFEMLFLREHFPFVEDKTCYFPLCYDINSVWKLGVNERKDFCFIGNFLHEPNRQAVLFLKKNWSQIRKQLPTAQIHIYGAYPNQQITQLHNEKEGFFVHGRVNDSSHVFFKHRVLLAPILSGAGLKGKLLEAMQHGIVSLTTPLGAEGIGDNDAWNGKVVSLADFPNEAANLYREDISYENYQIKGKNILIEKFNKTTIFPTVQTALENIAKHDKKHHFLTEIMNYHRQQSVRYLSKWIEEKNKK